MTKAVVYKPTSATSQKDNTPVQLNKSYTKNFMDYLRENGRFISGFLSFEGSATNTLYECPVGKEFYLTSITATIQNTAVINIPTCDVHINSDDYTIFTIASGSAASNVGNQAISYANPIKLVVKDRLIADLNRANCWVRVTYSGYEISSSIAQKN